jgi:cell wall-associated NlpC family hydrolase
MPETSKAGLFILWLLRQAGKEYRYGAEVNLTLGDLGNPHSFADTPAWDCSEMAQAGLWAAGVTKVGDCITEQFDGAGNQYLCCKPISPETAKHLPGALVFIQNRSVYPGKPQGIGHVAASLGNGYVVEARGKAYGVVISKWRDSFNLAGKVSELYA